MGGGGVGGGGFGSSKPVLTPEGSCITVSNVTVPNSFNFTIDGQSFVATDNFIGSNFTGVIVNGVTYLITLNSAIPISQLVNMELTEVSYLPILHTVNFSICPSTIISNTTTTASNIDLSADLVGSGLTIANVSQPSLINKITITNATNTPALPDGYTGIFIANITVNSSAVKNVNMSVSFSCSAVGSDSIQPYILQNQTWAPVNPFTVDTSTCTVSFTIPADPIIALAIPGTRQAKPLAPTATAGTAQANVGSSTTTMPQVSVAVSQKAPNADYTWFAMAGLFGMIVIAGFAVTRSRIMYAPNIGFPQKYSFG